MMIRASTPLTQKRRLDGSEGDEVVPEKVKIVASFDGAWQKRGTQKSYNSKSGKEEFVLPKFNKPRPGVLTNACF